MVKPGYKQTEIGVIPEDWDIKSLQDIVVSPLSYGVNAPAVPYDSNLYRYIRITDITEDGHYSKEDEVSVNILDGEKYCLCKGDILLVRTGASTGKTYLYRTQDGKLVYAGFLIRASVDVDNYNPFYVFAQFHTKRYQDWVSTMSIRSGQPGINGKEYSSYLLPIPKIGEQKQIASALSDIDALITNLEKLIAKKKAIKQGAMQELLTGKRRLPGFGGVWETVRLGDHCAVLRGGSPRPIQAYLTSSPQGANWIKIGDVREGDKYITATAERIIEAGISRSREVFVGDFILSNSMSFGRPYILKINGCIHDGWLVIQNYQDSFDQQYLYYVLGSDMVKSQYISMAAGSSVQNLNKEKVGNVMLHKPDIEEQHSIAAILSDMDEEISKYEHQLRKYKGVKQGMMSELLTGRIRLV